MANKSKLLIGEIRRKASFHLAKSLADWLGTSEVFTRSLKWRGFRTAFDSWHDSFWRWVDTEVPNEAAERIQEAQFDWSDCPKPTDQERRHDDEAGRQLMLIQLAIFTSGSRFGGSQNPEWYKSFGSMVFGSGQVGISHVFDKLAEMKQRKPAKDKGDRQLKFELLYFWMSGCLWVLTTKAVAEFLQMRFPRSGTGSCYATKTISDARHDLKLYRRPKPLYRIVKDTPPRFELV